MGKKMTYKKSFSRPEISIKLIIQKWCQKPSSFIIWGVMGIFYFTEKTKSILEGSVFSPWNFYYPPVINSQKSTREAKINTWSIWTKKPGVKAGVINWADFNAWKKKMGVINFKNTPVKTGNFHALLF